MLVIWNDWRVRSARSFALAVAAIAFIVIAATTEWLPLALAWAISGGLMVVIAVRPRWLAPLEPADLAMVEAIGAIERALVGASEAYRMGRLGTSELHDKFAYIRRQAADLRPPDDQWRHVLSLLLADLETTMSVVAGGARRPAEAVQQDRRRLRAIYSGLVDSRRRFWR